MTQPLPNAHDIERWTPSGLHEVVGCCDLVATFSSFTLNDGLPPNTLIHGPYGTGKSAIVKAYLQTAYCPHRSGDPPRPCGKCEDCTSYDCRHDELGLNAILRSRVLDNEAEPLNVYSVNCGDVGVDRFREIYSNFSEFHGQFIVFLDECHRLERRSADEGLLIPLENANICWIGATAHPEKLEPALVRRFTVRQSTSLPEPQELANFLADRCRDFHIGVDDPSTLALLAELSHCRPSECIRVLAQAALKPDRTLTHQLVKRHEFLPM